MPHSYSVCKDCHDFSMIPELNNEAYNYYVNVKRVKILCYKVPIELAYYILHL